MRTLLILILIFLPSFLFAQEEPINLGERLVYKIRWGILPAATATFNFLHDQNDSCYRVEYSSSTNFIGDQVKKLELNGVSLISSETLLPLEFANFGTANDTVIDKKWIFNQPTSVDYYNLANDSAAPAAVFKLVENTYDLLSGLINFRLHLQSSWINKSIGDSLVIPLVNPSGIRHVPIYYRGNFSLKIKGKVFETEKFEIVLDDIGRQLFHDANLTVYFSTKPHHLPLRMETGEMKILGVPGTVRAFLNFKKSSLPYDFP